MPSIEQQSQVVSTTVQVPPAFAAVEGQERACGYFAQALSTNKLSHAYLLCGGGQGAQALARALAKSIVCAQGGCNTCEECMRVEHGTHPDVREIKPESATGYLVGQVRDLIADTNLTPVRAKSKVYILANADKLSGASANALLKTLEEPPQGVVFVLLATSSDAVLSTIVSRCQQVNLKSNTTSGSSAADTQVIDANGVISRTPIQELAVQTALNLASNNSWEVLVAAQGLVAKTREPLEDIKSEQEAELEQQSEFLSSKAQKDVADANKRELTQIERSGMMEAIAAINSVLRDVLLCCEKQDKNVVNTDHMREIQKLSTSVGPKELFQAFEATRLAESRLAGNVTPQLTFEVMLLQVKEALTCQR